MDRKSGNDASYLDLRMNWQSGWKGWSLHCFSFILKFDTHARPTPRHAPATALRTMQCHSSFIHPFNANHTLTHCTHRIGRSQWSHFILHLLPFYNARPWPCHSTDLTAVGMGWESYVSTDGCISVAFLCLAPRNFSPKLSYRRTKVWDCQKLVKNQDSKCFINLSFLQFKRSRPILIVENTFNKYT